MSCWQVRRCASAGCVRYSLVHPTAALDTGLSDHLYSSLRDTDPLVVSNCLQALDQLLHDEGGVVINKPIAHYLLSKLHVYTHSSLETVLHFLKKYTPKDDAEVFDLLNPLDECFKSDNPGVLVESMELFLQWTTTHPNLKSHLITLVQPAFCRIFINSSPEICYLLLDFLISLGECVRESFNLHYRYFTLNPNDPSYLKEKKFEVFGLIALPVNVLELMSEVQPYCNDYNSYEDAVKCLGVLGNISDKGRQQVYVILPELLEAASEKIVAVSLECLLILSSSVLDESDQFCGNKTTANVLSSLGSDISLLPSVYKRGDTNGSVTRDSLSHVTAVRQHIKRISLPEALLEPLTKALSCPVLSDKHPCVVLHVLSTLCDVVDCCIPCLEQLQARQSSLSLSTQCLLLTTATRVFLSRPAQCYVILCRILQRGITSQHQAVRSQAALVYATLKQGTELTAKLF